MLRGFKEFIVRGNVIDLAVAVVIGAAFTAIVNSIVNEIFNPLIGALFNASSLTNAFNITIPTMTGDEPAVLRLGAVLGAVITFVIVAAVVYFVFVLPVNKLKERAEAKRKAGVVDEKAPTTEVDLLTEIRDLLVRADAERSQR